MSSINNSILEYNSIYQENISNNEIKDGSNYFQNYIINEDEQAHSLPMTDPIINNINNSNINNNNINNNNINNNLQIKMEVPYVNLNEFNNNISNISLNNQTTSTNNDFINFKNYNHYSDPSNSTNSTNSSLNSLDQNISFLNTNINQNYFNPLHIPPSVFYPVNNNLIQDNINGMTYQQFNQFTTNNCIPNFLNESSDDFNSYSRLGDQINMETTSIQNPRPMNAFLLFSEERRPELLNINPNLTEAMQTKLLSQEWVSMSEVQKLQYLDKVNNYNSTYFKSNSFPPVETYNKSRNAPKRPMNAYLLFNKEHRPRLLRENPNSTTPEVSKTIGDLWKSLKEEEKQVYINKANELKTQFFKDNPGYVFTRQTKINNNKLNTINQRGRRKRDKNSNAPKHPMSAFLFYLVANRSEIADQHTGNPIGPISRIISQRWNALSEQEKQPWIIKAEQDKKRYAMELKAFQISNNHISEP